MVATGLFHDSQSIAKQITSNTHISIPNNMLRINVQKQPFCDPALRYLHTVSQFGGKRLLFCMLSQWQNVVSHHPAIRLICYSATYIWQWQSVSHLWTILLLCYVAQWQNVSHLRDILLCQWRIRGGGVRGMQIHPPFKGLPSLALIKSAQT